MCERGYYWLLQWRWIEVFDVELCKSCVSSLSCKMARAPEGSPLKWTTRSLLLLFDMSNCENTLADYILLTCCLVDIYQPCDTVGAIMAAPLHC